MAFIDKKKPILITGATGYIASWIIKFLIDDGQTVIDEHEARTTVTRGLTDKHEEGIAFFVGFGEGKVGAIHRSHRS